MKKKFVSTLLVIICIFLLCGCASIEYQRVTDDTGKILDKLIIELDEKQLKAKGVDEGRVEKLRSDIEKDLDNYKRTLEYRRSELQLLQENAGLDFNVGVLVEVAPWVYADSTWKISVQVVYQNSTYYEKMNDSGDDGEDKESPSQIISDLFLSKYVMYADNVFSNIENVQGSDGKNVFEYYSSNFGEFSIEDVSFSQIYGTTDDRLKSNADYTMTQDGINYHLWEINSENSNYKTMKLSYYYTTAVGTGWYIVALALSFALAILLIIVYIIKKHKDGRYRKKIRLEEKIVQELEKDE